MGSLLLNFIKRAVIVPIVVTAIVIGAVYVVVPHFVNEKTERTSTASAQRIDLSEFDTREYKSFGNLTPGEYVGTISCESVSLGETPIIYDYSKTDVYALAGSLGPWENGGLVIVANDIYSRLGSLYNSQKGDVVNIEFYSNGKYQYKIQKKVVGVSADKLSSYIKTGEAAICVPYNDFTSIGNSYFYTIYIARKA